MKQKVMKGARFVANLPLSSVLKSNAIFNNNQPIIILKAVALTYGTHRAHEAYGTPETHEIKHMATEVFNSFFKLHAPINHLSFYIFKQGFEINPNVG